jgi:HEAT repeat protein
MYVATREPEEVAPAKGRLLTLLDDENAFVRGSASWVLGSIGGSLVRERLETISETDSSANVRRAAAAALDERSGREE